MRARIAIAVMVTAAGCNKEAPRYDGPLRVEFGDCAVEPAWVSGPRPQPITDKVAVKDPPKPADKPQAAGEGTLGKAENGGAFASLTGTGDISSGFDDTNIYGGLLGNEAGEMNGGFGYGRSGFGPGGGGTGWGTIGTGRYGTIGHGSGTGSGYGVGGRRYAGNVPTVSIGQPNAQGDLDKAIIRRYIKRNIQKIQYCYEKQLLAEPTLGGTVAVQFFIDPNGHVASSTASGMHPEVANCVAGVIKNIEFPKPKGGGGVQVNYPFTFRPAESSTGTANPTGTSVAVGDQSGDPGGYTADEISRVVKSRAGIYRACYQKELNRTPGIEGKVVVKFEINGEGNVTTAIATPATTLNNDAVKECLVRNIQRLKFPAKGTKASVTYPLVFAAGASPNDKPADPPADPKPAGPKIPPVAKPQIGAYRPGANNPLVAQSTAIEECLRRDAKHYGVVVIGLDPVAPKVEGVSDAVAECIADIAKTITPPKPAMKCSLAFGAMPIEELPSIEITASAINVDGAQIASVPAVLRDDAPTFKIDTLFVKLDGIAKAQAKATGPVGIEGPRVIRAAAATPIRVFNKVLNTTVAAGIDYVLATDIHDGVWKLIDPWQFPAVPVPRGTGGMWSHRKTRNHGVDVDEENVKLSILLEKDKMWVGLSRVNEFYEIPNTAGGADWEKLEVTLKQHKASAFFADRTDFDIAGETCTYGDLIRAIEIAHNVGFTDHEVTDPAGLTARPTL